MRGGLAQAQQRLENVHLRFRHPLRLDAPQQRLPVVLAQFVVLLALCRIQLAIDGLLDLLRQLLDHLSLGPPQDDWVSLERPMPVLEAGKIVGEVLFVDHFGNLSTNIPGEMLARLEASSVRVTVGDHEIQRLARTYDDAPRGEPIALVSSTCLLEIAINQGNAAMLLHVNRGDRVIVETA